MMAPHVSSQLVRTVAVVHALVLLTSDRASEPNSMTTEEEIKIVGSESR